MELDPTAHIVTLIIDVFTDKKHLHFVRAGSGSADENKDDEDKDDEEGEEVSALLHSSQSTHSTHSTH